MEYHIPIPGNGVFTLLTKHAECMIQDVNKRVFNIYLAGVLIQSNVDPYKEMGCKSGYNTYIEFEVRGSSLIINGQKIENALFPKNSQVLVMERMWFRSSFGRSSGTRK